RVYDNQRKNKKFAKWRSQLLKEADGEILELAVGAGANFAYYPLHAHVTAVDISPRMLDYAKKAAKQEQIAASFLLTNIEDLHFPEKSFDTIVSTLSFCGYDHPTRLLKKVQSWCKPGGKILLMEHGISTNAFVATTQK